MKSNFLTQSVLQIQHLSWLKRSVLKKVSHDIIIEAVRQFFDLRPYGLQEMLNLLQPIYKKTAAYGHFGREEFLKNN